MKLRRIFAVALCSCTVFSFSSYANLESVTATLNYNNIKITLDDQPMVPQDVNGNYVEPFTIDGTTYLPVRAIGTALGLSVGWDASTNTVTLTTGGSTASKPISTVPENQPRNVSATLQYNNIQITLDGKTVIPMSTDSKPVEPFTMDGTTYLPVRGVASILGLDVDWDASTNTVILESNDYKIAQQGVHGIEGVPDGWIEFSTGKWSTLLSAIADGDVIYRHGKYWASPDYVKSHTNEVVVEYIDISGGSGSTEHQDILGPDTVVTPIEESSSNSSDWVEPKDLSTVISKIGIEKIMKGQSASSSVSDTEILKYCMPSIPDDFVENPISGTYDGIRVIIENGKILLSKQDLQNHGFLQ